MNFFRAICPRQTGTFGETKLFRALIIHAKFVLTRDGSDSGQCLLVFGTLASALSVERNWGKGREKNRKKKKKMRKRCEARKIVTREKSESRKFQSIGPFNYSTPR